MRWLATILLGLLVVMLVLVGYGMLGGYRADASTSTVIVALHPGGGDGDRLCRSLGWPNLMCPQGEGGHWNSGWPGSSSTRDDVAFLMDVTAGYDRILVAGRSQGGMMALTWACHDPRVVRVLVKSGALPRSVDCEYRGAKVLRWHGRHDRVVPVAGDSGVNALWEDRRIWGCVLQAAPVSHLGVSGWRVAGCGFQSRLMDWGHGGVPGGFWPWAHRWLTMEEEK